MLYPRPMKSHVIEVGRDLGYELVTGNCDQGADRQYRVLMPAAVIARESSSHCSKG